MFLANADSAAALAGIEDYTDQDGDDHVHHASQKSSLARSLLRPYEVPPREEIFCTLEINEVSMS